MIASLEIKFASWLAISQRAQMEWISMGWWYVFITQISELVGIVGCAVEFKRELQFFFDGAELGAFISCVHWKNGSQSIINYCQT